MEDPIEFVHPHKTSTFCQRELGNDYNSFSSGLRAALREAPKVIFVGELRDRETTEIAITAAETGHLVVSTLHTINAGQSINRILGMFEQAEQGQMRQRLAETMRYIVAQRLAPKIGGGRRLVMEIMGSNLRVREAILLGEAEERNFYDITTASATYGWQTFDQSVIASYKEGMIDEETALAYSTRKAVVGRGIDQHKQAMGLASREGSGMRMSNAPEAVPPPTSGPGCGCGGRNGTRRARRAAADQFAVGADFANCWEEVGGGAPAVSCGLWVVGCGL